MTCPKPHVSKWPSRSLSPDRGLPFQTDHDLQRWKDPPLELLVMEEFPEEANSEPTRCSWLGQAVWP